VNAEFEVSLSGVSEQDVTVVFETHDGSAQEPGDYEAVSRPVTFRPGRSLTQKIPVPVKGDLVEAVEDYYQAVDQEDWAYTYQNLDSQTRAVFDEEEWYLKNQWFADTEGLELATMDVTVNGSPSDSVVRVNVYRTFTDGTVIDRDTFFVFEDGVWKHRFGEEEIGFFMPDASFDEFAGIQQGSSPSPGASAPWEGGTDG
jgi:hypothetical protein